MTSPVLTAVVLATAVAVMLACLRAVEWVWLRPRRLERCLRKQGLSGNPYRLLYGDMRDLTRLREESRSKPIPFTNDILPRANPQLHHTLLRYGKNSFTWMGPIPSVYITQPELIRKILTALNNFSKVELNPAGKILFPGLINYDGEKWAKHRKMLNPAFHLQKLKLMLPAFYESCAEMMDTWEKMATQKGSVELDVWPYLFTLSADVISRAAFGSSFKEGRMIFELLTEQTELYIQKLQLSYIPGWRFIPTKPNRRLNKINEEIQALIVGIIEKRKKAMEAGEEAPKEDLLGMLMENALDSEMKNVKGHMRQLVGMTTKEMIDECKLFYLVGQETTSVLLVWTIVMLSKHQVWQQRAREEVLKAFGKTKPDFDGLSQLQTVTMILYEVLRLYPPAGTLNRMTKQEVQLGDLSLPGGVMVNIPILLVHQDPKLWGNDALEFKPERFSEGMLKATGGNNAFFSFSWGPRICIGQHFSLIEVKMALAMVLQRFSFDLSPSYTHAPSSTVTLKPQFGASIVLHQL